MHKFTRCLLTLFGLPIQFQEANERVPPAALVEFVACILQTSDLDGERKRGKIEVLYPIELSSPSL